MVGIFSVACSRSDFHKHKCGSCDTIWEHSDECGGNEAAHKCPRCGKEEWYKYIGPEEPIVTNGLCKIYPTKFSWTRAMLVISSIVRGLNHN